MPTFTEYRPGSLLGDSSGDTDRTPSPAIWADCPVNVMSQNAQYGHHFFDDFHHYLEPATGVTATTAENVGPYYYHNDQGVTILSVDDTDFGQIQVAGNDAAQDGSVMAYGVPGGFARLGANSTDRVWFEARWQKASITNDACAFFLGLVEADVSELTVEATLTDTDTIPDASQDFVGFWNDGDDGDVVEMIYQEGSGTRAQVTPDLTIAASTWYKSGFKFVGNSNGGWLHFYHGNATTGLVLQASLEVTSALAFPDENHLCGLWATKTVLTAASTMNLDWWRMAAVGGNL